MFSAVDDSFRRCAAFFNAFLFTAFLVLLFPRHAASVACPSLFVTRRTIPVSKCTMNRCMTFREPLAAASECHDGVLPTPPFLETVPLKTMLQMAGVFLTAAGFEPQCWHLADDLLTSFPFLGVLRPSRQLDLFCPEGRLTSSSAHSMALVTTRKRFTERSSDRDYVCIVPLLSLGCNAPSSLTLEGFSYCLGLWIRVLASISAYIRILTASLE